MNKIAILCLAIALSSCGTPMDIRTSNEYGTYTYTSKRGLSVEIIRAFK
jgi:hypothetical protein